MKQLDVIGEGPVRDMILAINHYVSTGDHIGEGIALEGLSGDYLFAVPFDPQSADDLADARCFERRLREIVEDQPAILLSVSEQKEPGQFDYLLVSILPSDLRKVAAALVRSAGQAGWGSGKPLIDEHFPDVRAKILSGEGV